VTGEAVVFSNTSLTFPVPLPAVLLIPVTAALVQANVDPEVALVAVYANVAPLHTAAGVSVLLNAELGFTATVTF